jgi:hypothetical protein
MTAPAVTAQLAATRTSHRWNELPGGFDTLNLRALFASSNEWGIPDLPSAPANWLPVRLVPYNDRYACDTAAEGSTVHFFLDDYRFETVWAKPERPLTRLTRVGTALTPDFSLWLDMPPVMQMWQVYRARWCGAWMAHHGIRVIPTVSWSNTASFGYAFAGIAAGSVVAVSTVGVRGPEAQAAFAAGYAAMLDQVQPACVLVYGVQPPPEVTAGTPTRVYPTRWRVR